MDRSLGLTALLVAVAIAAGCASSDRYSAVSAHSGKCLSLALAGGYYDGDPVEQWNCTHYHMGLGKEWLFVPLKVTSNYQVKSIKSGKCLEVALTTGGKKNGDVAQQSKCTGANNQVWNVVTTSAGATFKSVLSGKCLQVRPGSTGGMKDGDAIEQWTCSAGAKNQRWNLTAADPPPPNPPLDTAPGGLCNVCNPGKPNCKPGALCIVLTSGQSVCGQSCSSAKPCPSGYLCTAIVKKGQKHYQCVPKDYSCPL